MSKSFFAAVVSLTLLAPIEIRVAGGTETATRLSPTRVIELGTQNRGDRPPVVSSVALDGSGRLLAAGGDDHLVRLQAASTGRTIGRLAGHTDWVRAVAFRAQGDLLASGGADRRIILWDTSTGRRRHVMTDPVHAIFALAFSPDGRTLVASGFENRLRVYDVAGGRLIRTLDAPGGDVRALAFAPDGTRLAAAGRTGRIRIWQMPSGQVTADLEGPSRRVCALAWSPDGATLASGGEGAEVLLWDPNGKKQLGSVPARPGKVLSLVFCGPTELAAGGSYDVIRVWDLATGHEKYQLVGHTGSVTLLAWDPRGGVLFSGSYDTTVRLWQLSGQPMEVISRR